METAAHEPCTLLRLLAEVRQPDVNETQIEFWCRLPRWASLYSDAAGARGQRSIAAFCALTLSVFPVVAAGCLGWEDPDMQEIKSLGQQQRSGRIRRHAAAVPVCRDSVNNHKKLS